MEIVVGIIVGLLVLMTLVTAHEFGHFLAARRNGVRVLEFGIGFPPRACAWVKDVETGKWRRLPRSEWNKNEKVTKTVISDDKLAQKGLIFSLNWLPIGGFCQMDGESAADARDGTFGKARFFAKTKILFAGVAMNWLVAFVILTILAWVGMPQMVENQFTVEADTRMERTPVMVARVVEDSPAGQAGMREGDYIVAVDGQEFGHAYEITDYNATKAGQEVVYTIERPAVDCEDADCDGGDETVTMNIAMVLNTADAEYLMGVSMATTQSLVYSTWSAPIVGAGLTLQLTGETFRGVGELIWNLVTGVGAQFSFEGEVRESGQAKLTEVEGSVSGPVGIIGQLFPAFTASGANNLLFLAAVISISLACMNVLPIPALDGGRWLLFAIYKIRKKPLTRETEEKIVSRSMLVLLGLMFIVTIIDITRFFR